VTSKIQTAKIRVLMNLYHVLFRCVGTRTRASLDVINTIWFKMHNLKITFFTIGQTLSKRLTGYSYASVKAALSSERTSE